MVTKEMTIGEVLNINMVHGIDADLLVEKINAFLKANA